MGARETKMANKNEGKDLGDAQKSERKIEKKQRGKPGKAAHKFDVLASGEEMMTKEKKRLQELHMAPPPGFRKFESEVDWRTIDADIALQLWEDVFKPLYTFHRCTRIAK